MQQETGVRSFFLHGRQRQVLAHPRRMDYPLVQSILSPHEEIAHMQNTRSDPKLLRDRVVNRTDFQTDALPIAPTFKTYH